MYWKRCFWDCLSGDRDGDQKVCKQECKYIVYVALNLAQVNQNLKRHF